jgi:hypothetical protein
LQDINISIVYIKEISRREGQKKYLKKHWLKTNLMKNTNLQIQGAQQIPSRIKRKNDA